MISLTVDSKDAFQTLNNAVGYAAGFLDGVQRGKKNFLNALGIQTLEALKQFIDSNARVSPQTLHHMYEWYQTGSPNARLFDINYTVSNIGLSFNSTFRQSQVIKAGSTTPFYDKARIMEQGIPVTIQPKRARALSFEDDGEQVFTKGPITVSNPGGDDVSGSFERTLDLFFKSYFTQAFLMASGLSSRIKNPYVFKKDLRSGARSGRSRGVSTGYKWISNVVIN